MSLLSNDIYKQEALTRLHDATWELMKERTGFLFSNEYNYIGNYKPMCYVNNIKIPGGELGFKLTNESMLSVRIQRAGERVKFEHHDVKYVEEVNVIVERYKRIYGWVHSVVTI